MAEDSDDWEPTDDPDYWAPDGKAAYQGNPDGILWRIVTPSGDPLAVGAYRLAFKTRESAVGYLANPGLAVTVETFRKLRDEDRTVAGWAKIAVDGWTVEPMTEPIKPNA